MYEKWKQRSKIDHQSSNTIKQDDGDEDNEGREEFTKLQQERNRTIEKAKQRKAKKNKSERIPRKELKTKEEIFKVRSKLEKLNGYQKWKTAERQKKIGKTKRNNSSNNSKKRINRFR